MVSPIYIFIALLGAGFLLNIFYRFSRDLAAFISLIVLLFAALVSAEWFIELYQGGHAQYIFTAGFRAPISINLRMGQEEAFFSLLVNIAGFAGAAYMWKKLRDSAYNLILYILMIMGLNGLIMTRDIFNLFVFLEISSIAAYSLIAFIKETKSFIAGFRYMLAGSIISGLLLLGIIFLYHNTHTLNLDEIIAARYSLFPGTGILAIFLFMIALIIEQKPMPANGWGIDIYQGASPGMAGVLSAAFSSALFFVLAKAIPMANPELYRLVSWAGAVTFIGSNLVGLRQKNCRRLLGYSSIGQMGLLMIALGLRKSIEADLYMIISGLIISHFFAKAGLFWLAGILKRDNLKEWAILKTKPLLLVLFGVFIFALLGFPPFPSFAAKFRLILSLVQRDLGFWAAAILAGSLLEAVYLFRWFGYAVRGQVQDEKLKVNPVRKTLVLLFGLLVVAAGYFYLQPRFGMEISPHIYGGMALAAIIWLLDFLPARIKGLITIFSALVYSAFVLPGMEGINLVFNAIFLLGSAVILIATLGRASKSKGFYPLIILTLTGLSGVAEAGTLPGFFFAWELLALASFLLIIRGPKSEKHALSYMLFSIGGAFLILLGFAFIYKNTGSMSLAMMSFLKGDQAAVLPFILMGLGFLTKLGAIGFHIWLPGSYAEAEDDISPIFSGVLTKVGIFGFAMLILNLGNPQIGNIDLLYIVGWIGALTGFFGTLMAIFQEDAKYLVAYSSMAHTGYMLFALSMANHIGWVTAILHAVIHLLFGSTLFMALRGIHLRTGTRDMYKMGGLIKKMPFSFISVMMSIIALSGVPPLIGFGSKWFFYNSVIVKGWAFQGAVMFFAGVIAFLYCFRLIYTIFLGQIKDNHRQVKEAPLILLSPQYIFLMLIMTLSFKPAILLEPLGTLLSGIIGPQMVVWSGDTAYTELGYWNATMIMNVVSVVFGLLFVWLLYIKRKSQKVSQFNIVYAAESPERPETTHIAYNFYAPYKKALGMFTKPLISRVWETAAEGFHTLAEVAARIYSGNAQSYLFHIIAYVVIVYFIFR